MALLEAMAMGIPIVATAVGGVPDIIEDGKNGLLIKAGDPLQLSETIMKIINDKNISNKFSKNGRQIVENKFSIERWVNKITDNYLELIVQKDET